MAYNNSSRLSTFSSASARPVVHQPSAQVSTTTLLNALHTAFASRQPYPLEPSTSLVVNTWISASNVGPDGRFGGTVDVELGRKAWEHARRRAEDGCIILGYVSHQEVMLRVSIHTCIDTSSLDLSTNLPLRCWLLLSPLCHYPFLQVSILP